MIVAAKQQVASLSVPSIYSNLFPVVKSYTYRFPFNCVHHRYYSLICLCFSSDKMRAELPSVEKIRNRCMEQIQPDHIRRLNPTPYKVSSRSSLFPYLSSIISSCHKNNHWPQTGKCEREAIQFHPFPMA